MSPKLFKISLVSILIIGLVILGVILVRAKNKRDAAAIITDIENPFGIPSDDALLNGAGGTGDTGDNQNEEGDTSSPQLVPIDFVSVSDDSILQKISQEPVAGAAFHYIERDIIIPEEVSANLVEGYDFTGYPTLAFGADQKEVADVKTVLNRQDPSPALAIDNAFDTSMKNAVIDFQIRSSLSPDGVVGPAMYRKLNDFQGIAPKPVDAPKKETIEYVRFVDRANGYIYDKTTKLDEPIVRVTSTPIARVYEAYFDATRSKILMRYLRGDKVENLIATIVPPEVESETSKGYATLDTELLSDSITFVSVLPGGQKALYLEREPSGVFAFSYDFKTKKANKVWDSRFSEWLPQWVSDNVLSLTTLSSGRYPGNSYILDVKNNSLKNVVANVPGLTTNISPDGKKIIYSAHEDNTLKTYLLDVASGQISAFSPITLPEKCAWTSDSKFAYCGAPSSPLPALYPDDWYKGEVLFSDMLWKIDIEENTSKIIVDSSHIPYQIDITSPAINKAENHFIFINKHDNYLYGIDLDQLP